MKKYIFFYSDRCTFSTKIKTALESLSIFPYIHLFQIDEQIELVPESITRVPTIVVSAKEQYVGETILKWANTVSIETSEHGESPCLLSEPMSLAPLSTMEYTFVDSSKEDVQKNTVFNSNDFSLIENPDKAMNAYKEQQQTSKKCTQKDYETFLKERENIQLPSRQKMI
tara:strand:- start:93 stop:602 length:510 start_codon:yes stop_codon:yes gene_type:complete